MAHLSRLIWFALGVMLAGLPMLAFAYDYPYVSQYRAWSVGATYEVFGSTPEQAAQAFCEGVGSYNGRAVQGPGSVVGGGEKVECDLQKVDLSGWVRFTVGFLAGKNGCPYGGTLSGTMCIGAPACEDGMVRDGDTGQCVPMECPQGQIKNPFTGDCQAPCPVSGTRSGRLHSQSGNPICQFGCLMTRGAAPGGSTCVLSLDMGTSGGSALICDYGYTGGMCGWVGEMAGGDNPPIPEAPGEDEPPPPPPDTEPAPPEPEPCPAGFESQSVNGASVCVNSGPPVKNQNTTTTNTTTNNTTNNTTTNTTTTTTTNNVYNQQSNTTTTTTTTTVNETTINNTTGEVVGGGSVTTVVQETTPGNGVPEATDGNGNGAGECDPTTGECGGGSVWSAACGGEVRCEGDPIQCAIARAQHEMKCALLVEDDVLTQFSAIKDFNGAGPGEGLDRKEIQVPGSLAVTEIGGGAGLVNQSFTVMGQVIEIPFSDLNRFIAMLGYAIMVIAWLGAWRIIAGAF